MTNSESEFGEKLTAWGPGVTEMKEEKQTWRSAPNEPKNLMEWLWRLKRYEDGIFVREQGAGGKWGNAKLSDLPPERWAFHVARWLEEGSLPCRILEPQERTKTK